MISVPILLRNTPRDVLSRASKCGILGFFASKGIDQVLKSYVAVVCGVACRPPHGSGKLHRVELHLYKPPDKRSSLFGKNSALWCTCSCEYFCVDKNTRISTSKGFSKIKDLKGNVTVLTRKGPKPANVFFTGKAPTLLLKTVLGYAIRGTENERFLVLQPNLKKVWKRLDQIKSGDFVAVKPGAVWPTRSPKLDLNTQHLKKNFPKVLTRELAALLGYLVGASGSIHNIGADTRSQEILFIKRSKAISDNIVTLWNACFDYKLLSSNKTLKCDNVPICKFFKEVLNYDRSKAYDARTIPDIIFNAPKEHVSSFLAAYFDINGFPSSNGIEYYSSSKKIANGLLQLLWLLGIRISRYGIYDEIGQPKNYFLDISELDAINYEKEVSPYTKNKTRLLLLDKKKERGRYNKKRYGRYFPLVKDAIQSTINKDGYYLIKGKRTKLRPYSPKTFDNVADVEEHALKCYVNGKRGRDLKIISPSIYKRILSLLNSDERWEKVESVGSPKVVSTYDATVPACRSFVANGFVVHNTYNLEVALSLKGNSSLLNSNGKLPNIKNPRYIPYVCKHLAAAIYTAQRKSSVSKLREKL